MQSRTWSLILRILPTPIRWVGWEFVRAIHWVDRGAGRLVVGMRTSPAWYFVTMVGSLGVGLTILLFVSAIEQTSAQHSKPSNRAIAHLGRAHLEKNYEWSAQDRWRVAHFFVPNKPPERPKDIQIDSRLITSEANASRSNTQSISGRTSLAHRSGKEFEVRLDLSRPRKAQQTRRLVSETILDTASSIGGRPESRIRSHDPRLLVQAAWEFGSECRQNDYVSLPIRRTIPLPVPEPEIPRVPLHRPQPDITLEMAMFRHFSTSGLFPPGSHLVSQSDRSAFPVDDSRYQSELVSYGDHRWQNYDLSHHHVPEEAIPYEGIGIYDPTSGVRQTSDEFDATLPSVADINLHLEMVVPDRISSGRRYESKIIVRNEGQETISRIEVQDSISKLETVIDANPEATVESNIDLESGLNEKIWHRDAEGLEPGDIREFALRWIPEGGRRHHHRVRVISQAAISTLTEVNPPDPDQQMPSIPPESAPEKHPALACDVHYLDRVSVGDDLELDITVRNTGDTTLHNVQVRIELPSQLSHRNGTHVAIDAGNILVRGHNRHVVKLSATQAGDAVNVVQVAAAEQVEAHGKASILVVERTREPEPRPTPPAMVKPNPPTISSPARKLSPSPQPPAGECCCQRSP